MRGFPDDHLRAAQGGNHARNLEQGGMAAVEEFLAAIESRSPDRASTGAVTPARAP